MRLFAATILALGLLLGAPAGAKVVAADEDEADAVDEVELFIIGNTAFTLYHEFGHALVDELALPVLGREEDAVDNLATLVMIPDEDDDDTQVDLIFAAAEGWLLSHADNGDGDLPFWDEHGLDLQRFYSVVCMTYGSDPETFREMAEAAELPAGRRDRCPSEFERTAASWLQVLEPHFAGKKRSGEPVRVVYGKPGRKFAHLEKMLKDWGLVEDIAQDIADTFVLPHPLTVRVKSCGEANAFWDPDKRSVTLCYELVDYFETLARKDMAN